MGHRPGSVDEAGRTEHRDVPTDGTPVVVRTLTTKDRAAFIALHERQLGRDRWLRFLSGAPAGTDAYPDRALGGIDSEVLGAFLDGELAGVVHVAVNPAVPTKAEITVAVGHAVQWHGVGTLLLEHAARASRRRGVTRWTALVLSENQNMLRVLDDLGLPVQVDRDGAETNVERSPWPPWRT